MCSVHTSALKPPEAWLIQNRKSKIVLPFESVSTASDRNYARGVAGVFFDLLPEPSHVYIHCATVADEVPAPDTLQDEFAREHMAFVFR